MTNQKHAGFTLIELLVVVLIIGILSAVALPQYEKAVEKSRVTDAELVLKSLREAQALCILNQGGFDADLCGTGDPDGDNLFETMEINFNFQRATDSGELIGAGLCLKGRDFYYCLEGNGYIAAYRIKGEECPYNLTTTAVPNQEGYNYIYCGGDDCKKIGYTQKNGDVWVK